MSFVSSAKEKKAGKGRRAASDGSAASPVARRVGRWVLLAALALGAGTACAVWAFGSKAPPTHEHEVVNVYPHQADAFCQGLAYEEGVLFESTGVRGQSSLRRVDLKTGNVLKKQPLSPNLFGEGMAVWGDRIYQLTWETGVCLVWDKESFKLLGRFPYRGEGWGLTHDGKRLIMSNGSNVLKFRDPKTFKVTGTLRVHSQGRAVRRLNELEYVNGEIYANVYEKNRIARISPETGEVLGWIDLSKLLTRKDLAAADLGVLNGIAFDKKGNRLFVTGKNWPKLFEIRLAPKE